MTQLENLVSKIEQNGNNAAQEIIKQAENEAAALLAKRQAEGEALKATFLMRAEEEAKGLSERISQKTRLSARDNRLVAKQKVIDSVFEEALKTLSAMNSQEYTEFVVSRLKSSGMDEGELVLPKGITIDKEALSKCGQFTVNTERQVKNGFILLREGIEYNNTFDSLLSYSRDDLEAFVSSRLF